MQMFLPVVPKLSFITVFFFFNLFDQEFSQGSHIAFSYHASLISFTLEKSPHTYFLWIFFFNRHFKDSWPVVWQNVLRAGFALLFLHQYIQFNIIVTNIA